MPKGELLGDHRPHREAQHVSLLNLQRVEQAGDVVGHVCDRVGSADRRTAADVAVVEDHHPEPS
jgi:hypothetical protein